MFDVDGFEISHDGLGIGAGHIKSRHRPAGGVASTRNRCCQEFDKFRVAPRWQAGKSWSSVRPSLHRPRGFIKHRCTFEPSRVVWIAVLITGRVTVSATRHTFYNVLASRVRAAWSSFFAVACGCRACCAATKSGLPRITNTKAALNTERLSRKP